MATVIKTQIQILNIIDPKGIKSQASNQLSLLILKYLTPCSNPSVHLFFGLPTPLHAPSLLSIILLIGSLSRQFSEYALPILICLF